MNMTQIELDTLSGLVTELEKIRSDVSAFMQLEEQIYLCIAKSTRNPLWRQVTKWSLKSAEKDFVKPTSGAT